jgi:hypothetical protein
MRKSDLIAESYRLKSKIHTLENEIHDLKMIIKNLNEIPDDCKPGLWCAGCIFHVEYFDYGLKSYYCNKHNSCKQYQPIIKEET